MNENPNKNEKNTGKSGELPNMGFVDDFASDNIKSNSALRNRNGSVVYSNPLEDEKKPKRKVTKMNRKRYRKQNAGIIVIALFLFIVLALSVYLIIKSASEPRVGEEERTTDTVSSVSDTESLVSPESEHSENPTDTVITSDLSGDKTVLPNTEIHKGNLILVNYKYEYVFPEEDILVSMFDRDALYSVSTTETYIQKEALDHFSELINDLYENSGCDDVIVVSAFRSVEKQKEIYEDRLEKYGSEYAAAYVADPGFSEHHTGLAMDLSIYDESGMTYDIDTYPNAKWFMENFSRYGYILRYPADKAGITSINFESWHYRYVGLPHSLIMGKLNYCHEEYIDYLRNYTYGGKVLRFTMNGSQIEEVSINDTLSSGQYFVYFVPASDKDETEIPLPEGYVSEISGNNVDGFIVTSHKQ